MKKISVLSGIVGAVALSMTASSAQAKAREIRLNAPMIPIAYGYGACVFDSSKGDVATRIQLCAELKQALLATSNTNSGVWQRGHEPSARRRLERSLSMLDAEARYADANRESVPDSIIGYMGCVSDTILGSTGYQKGTVIDFTNADRQCRDYHVGDAARETAGLENRLYHRLRLTGRAHAPVGQRLRSIRYRFGLLHPSSR